MGELVSVVVPAYASEKSIRDCVKSLFRQDYRPCEIIVIDDASKDGTYRILSKMAGITVVRHERNMGLAAALNEGFARAKGKYVLTLHDDCELPSTTWITDALHHFSDANVAAVSGAIYEDLGEFDLWNKLFRVIGHAAHEEAEGSPHEVPFVENRCTVYDKKKVSKTLSFSKAFFCSGEDQDLCYSLRANGYRIVLDNALHVKHRFDVHQGTLWKNLQHERLYGESALQLFLKHPGKMVGNLSFSCAEMRRRALYRVSIMVFMGSLLMLLPLALLDVYLASALVGSFILLRCLYYWRLGLGNIRVLQKPEEILLLAPLGLLIDISYFFGAVRGLFGMLLGIPTRNRPAQ